MSHAGPSSNIYSTKKRKKRGGKKTKNRKRKQIGGGGSRKRQLKDRNHDIDEWNKMKQKMKSQLYMKFVDDYKFVEELLRDVKIIDFDNMPNRPYSEDIMKEKN